ncbi:CPBP family intramembrane metalloprotease [Staphylococcus chromogenes]|uniref:CPBP family intramembrane metalloprotease n=1 Tax=Staphylococcus agnetis TaxID=985762 RepID=A0ABX3Z5I6_9STAP|nr:MULTISPECIES: CPBP family intramembrane glutamic endopeptidase [Staphylococcus]ALN76742.1 CPBP family intramembrane metalloprotease [Staphylococcus agnetis]MDG4942801.1 CPBP family intramembrane metalloprotease [Staphylococcus agnetis]OSP20437.1 CPBP family intramembrane metalloprotease [Staphylococcus agnetis]OSP25120.1 CPBP family intramembrane metalloprotease [Staphylococcus agnetis]OTW31145.1 CPBP family intramembrane metalloprotease [Staphylococcus agnetis]
MKNVKKSIVYFIFISLLLSVIAIISLILPFSNYTNDLIAQSIVTISIILYLIATHKFQNLKINTNNILKGFLIGIYILLMAVLNLLSSIETIESIKFTFTILFSLIMTNFMIALFEEVLCRGLVFNNFLKNNNPLKAGVFSSAVFGLAHILNLTHNPDLIGVLTQVIYTFFIGMLFAAVYFYTKNLLSVILLHFILDLTSGFDELKTVETITHHAATSFTDMLITVIISLPCFLIGYYLLKKKSV